MSMITGIGHNLTETIQYTNTKPVEQMGSADFFSPFQSSIWSPEKSLLGKSITQLEMTPTQKNADHLKNLAKQLQAEILDKSEMCLIRTKLWALIGAIENPTKMHPMTETYLRELKHDFFSCLQEIELLDLQLITEKLAGNEPKWNSLLEKIKFLNYNDILLNAREITFQSILIEGFDQPQQAIEKSKVLNSGIQHMECLSLITQYQILQGSSIHDLADTIEDANDKSLIFFTLAEHHFSAKDFQRALEIATFIPNDKARQEMLDDIFCAHESEGLMEAGLNLFESFEYEDKTDDLIWLGNNQFSQGNPMKALNFFQLIPDETLRINQCLNLANLLIEASNPYEALNIIEQLPILDASQDYHTIILSKIALYLTHINDLDTAVDVWKQMIVGQESDEIADSLFNAYLASYDLVNARDILNYIKDPSIYSQAYNLINNPYLLYSKSIDEAR